MAKMSVCVLVTAKKLAKGELEGSSRKLEYRIVKIPEHEVPRQDAQFDDLVLLFNTASRKVKVVDTSPHARTTIMDLKGGKYHKINEVWFNHRETLYPDPKLEQEAPRPEKEVFHRPSPSRRRRRGDQGRMRPQPILN